MSEVLYRTKIEFNPTSSYFIEIYYQKKPKGKWYYVDKLFLFNKGQFDNTSERYILFSVLNHDTTREKLKRKVKIQKTSLYTGASQKFISIKFKQFINRFIKYPLYRIKDTVIIIPFYASLLLQTFIDKFIKLPIIKKYGKNIEIFNIKFGAPELKPLTKTAFEQIFLELEKLVKQINNGAKKEAKIKVTMVNGKIILSRYKLSIVFYISGDKTIHVKEQYSHSGSRLSYSIELKNKIWNKKYWYLHNYGFITIKSFVIRVLDAFVIHSNY